MREIVAECAKLEKQLIAWRRHFHRHPELGGEEVKTSAYIAEVLKEFCDETLTQVGGNGIVGILKGARAGPTLALRADMDALPIMEATGVSYVSSVPGVMHACGHDAHCAILLGAARILSRHKNFAGCIKFLFQPAEELLPQGGAQAMIDAGVLKNPRVDALFALHVSAGLPCSQISIPLKTVMAGGDVFQITLTGKGTHGAIPQNGVDCVTMAAHAIMGIQSMVNRSLDAREAGVVSVCSVNGGVGCNVLPDSIQLQGTVRYLNPNLKCFFKERLDQVLNGVSRQFGGGYRLDYQFGYPPTVNHPALVQKLQEWVRPIPGLHTIHTPDFPEMFSEDISRYFEKVPGCYFWLGAGIPGNDASLHNPGFNLDEQALALGCAIMVQSSLRYLNEPPDVGFIGI